MSNYEELERRWERLQAPLKSALPSAAAPAGFLHLARTVAGVPDPDMTCEECQALLPLYVEDEAGGLPVESLMPRVSHHLALCDACLVDYFEMQEGARLEEEMVWLDGADYVPDLSFLPKPSLVDYVQVISQKLVKRLVPEQMGDYLSRAEMWLETVAYMPSGYRFQPSDYLGDDIEAIDLLKVSYNTTQSLLKTWSASELATATPQRELFEKIRQQAEAEARQHLGGEQAQRFAEQYAQLVSQEPAIFRSLLGG